MKITIWADGPNKEKLDKIASLNRAIKRVYIYEALLTHCLDNLPKELVTTRDGFKVPAGMTLKLDFTEKPIPDNDRKRRPGTRNGTPAKTKKVNQ